jgi:hypothetical protein
LPRVNTTNGTNVLAFTLQVDTRLPAAFSPQVTGQVSNGSWDAVLMADLAPAWTAKNPAPQRGYYTMILPGNLQYCGQQPGGDSCGTVTVDALGNLTAVLSLADGVGASVSQSVPVAASGVWPLYFNPSAGPRSRFWAGWASTPMPRPASAGRSIGSKPRGREPYYPNGFDTNSVLQGGIYVKTNILILTNPVHHPHRRQSVGSGHRPRMTVSGKGNYESADQSV